MSIIQIDSSYLETAQKNELIALLYTDAAGLDTKVINLNPVAEGYIEAKVLSISDISDNTMKILKELYATYRLYQQVEREQIAEDKKTDLDEMLSVTNENQRLRSKNEITKDNTTTTMFVYSKYSPRRVGR